MRIDTTMQPWIRGCSALVFNPLALKCLSCYQSRIKDIITPCRVDLHHIGITKERKIDRRAGQRARWRRLRAPRRKSVTAMMAMLETTVMGRAPNEASLNPDDSQFAAQLRSLPENRNLSSSQTQC